MLCRIGDVEVWRILEINAPFLSAEDMFPDAGPELIPQITKNSPKGQFTAKSKLTILPVQGFLLRTPDHLILVDACIGNDKTNKGIKAWNKRSDPRFMAALLADKRALGSDVPECEVPFTKSRQCPLCRAGRGCLPRKCAAGNRGRTGGAGWPGSQARGEHQPDRYARAFTGPCVGANQQQWGRGDHHG